MTLLNPKTPIHPPYFLPTSFFLLQLLRLEKTSEIISSSHQAIPTMPYCIPQCHIPTALGHLQGR